MNFKTALIFTALSFNIRRELERQKSAQRSFSKDDLLRWWRCMLAMWGLMIVPASLAPWNIFQIQSKLVLPLLEASPLGTLRPWGIRSKNTKRRSSTKRQNICCTWEIGNTLMRTLDYNAFSILAWSIMRCAFGNELWVLVEWLRIWATTFKGLTITGFQRVQTGLLSLRKFCSRNLHLRETIRLVH